MKAERNERITILAEREGKETAWKVILSMMIVVAFTIIGAWKSGYHLDEMFTMGLSNRQYNGSINPEITDGVVYTGQQLWQEYTNVDANNRFDYANVIENQKHDVHPPLYYIVVHTVFSLFPDTYSLYYLLAVNVGFALIVFWQMVWLFQYFTARRKISVLLSLLFIFTMGFVNNVMFFRMYVLLTVWTNALTMLFCKYRTADQGWKYYATLVFVLTGGTMTHYYFIIFAFFACGVYAVRLAVEMKWRKIRLSCVSVALSAGISTLLFPTMWRHIFISYRGKEAFANLTSDGLWTALWNYLDVLNLYVFGGLFVFLLFLGIALYIIGSGNFKLENLRKTVCDYFQLIIPVICYVFLIARIAPNQSGRYTMNIMGIMYLSVFSILIRLACHYSGRAAAGIVTIALLVLFCSYKEGVLYLYTSERENIATIEDLDENVSCLYLYDIAYEILPNYLEMKNLDEIVFVQGSNLELLADNAFKGYDKVLVYVDSTLDAAQVINQLLEQNFELSSYTRLFSYGYATAYYLE